MDGLLDLLRPLLGSALVIGALLVVRHRVTNGPTTASPGRLRVADRVAVGRGSSVVVVEVDERRFLVGAGEHGVSVLHELGARQETVPVTTEMPALVVPPARPTPIAPTAAPAPIARTDADDHLDDGPRSGLVDRMRRMTVRTHVEGPLREPV